MPGMEEVVERCRRVAADVAAAEAEETDRNPRWTEQTIRALQKEGLAGLVVPAANGGLGMGLEAVAATGEVLGEASPSAAISFGMHHVGTATIAANPTDDQVERYLRPIAHGRHVTTIALSEPGTGAAFWVPETSMRRRRMEYEVTGGKTLITNGGHADSYVLSADAGGATPEPGMFSCILVDKDAAGLSWGPRYEGLGLRGNSARSLTLEGARVPIQNRLGREGDELWYLFNVIAPYFIVAMAGAYVGLARRALGEALSATSHRKDGEHQSPLRRLDVSQYRLGETWARYARARALLHEAARARDRRDDQGLPALFAAKAEATRTAVRVVNDCLTFVGGRGYRDGSVLERLLRDARAGPVMAPTSEMLYTWAGRFLLNEPLLGE